MPRCDCGFNLAQAHLKGRKLESYAVISDDEYQGVVREEKAVLEEKNPKKRWALIGKTALSVGSLVRCPECGAWILARPLKSGRGDRLILRESGKPPV